MNGKSIVIGIAILIAGVGAGYYFATNYPSTSSGQATEVPTATPTVDEKAALLVAVKSGLVAEHGPDANDLTVTVSKIGGNFAQGGASEQGGGAMWLAAKVSGEWKLVWDGNGTISCEKTDPHHFPVSIVPTTLN